MQAPPDGDGASPICHCCVLYPSWHVFHVISWLLWTIKQRYSPLLLGTLICFEVWSQWMNEVNIYSSMQENDKVSGALLSWHSAGTGLMGECVEIALFKQKTL